MAPSNFVLNTHFQFAPFGNLAYITEAVYSEYDYTDKEVA